MSDGESPRGQSPRSHCTARHGPTHRCSPPPPPRPRVWSTGRSPRRPSRFHSGDLELYHLTPKQQSLPTGLTESRFSAVCRFWTEAPYEGKMSAGRRAFPWQPGPRTHARPVHTILIAPKAHPLFSGAGASHDRILPAVPITWRKISAEDEAIAAEDTTINPFPSPPGRDQQGPPSKKPPPSHWHAGRLERRG